MLKLKPTGLLPIVAIWAGVALIGAVACSTGADEPGVSGPTPDDVSSFPTPLGGLSNPVGPQTANAEADPDGPSKPTGTPPAIFWPCGCAGGGICCSSKKVPKSTFTMLIRPTPSGHKPPA